MKRIAEKNEKSYITNGMVQRISLQLFNKHQQYKWTLVLVKMALWQSKKRTRV